MNRPRIDLTPRKGSKSASIRFISVNHYTKQNGKCLFACRVIGQSENEAYTVYKSWDDFHLFAQQLLDSLGAEQQKQLPRLSKKLALFVTRSTLTSRRDELDLWVRRLVENTELRNHDLLHDFFSHSSPNSPADIRPRQDMLSETIRPQRYPHRPSISRAATEDPFARQPLSPMLGLPIQHYLDRPELRVKRSTPNLRYHEELEMDLPPTPRATRSTQPSQLSSQLSTPPLEANEDPLSVATGTWQLRPSSPLSSKGSILSGERPSMDSLARSFSTEHTITPSNFNRSISSAVDEEPPQVAFTPISVVSKPLPPPPRPKGLRHFMSLQDIRQHVLPHPSVQTVPPPLPSAPLTAPLMSPSSRSRSSSSASEYGTTFAPFGYQPAMMMRDSGDFSRTRRLSNRSQSSVRSGPAMRAHRPSGSNTSHHTYSYSNSSLSSLTRGNTSGASSSRDSLDVGSPASLDYPITPPAPVWQEAGFANPKQMADQEAISMFSVNLVPLPASFAVASSPRNPSFARSRSSSLAFNNRQALDPIVGSPTLSSYEEHITIKVRHRDANVVFKIQRSAGLDEVKAKIAEKMSGNGIQMPKTFDAWICARQQPTTDDSSPVTANLPTDTEPVSEQTWLSATVNGPSKLVLLC